MSVDAIPAAAGPPVPESLYEPGRRGRWVAPALVAVAGMCVIEVILIRTLLVPNEEAAGGTAGTPILRSMGVVFEVGAVVLGVVGVALGRLGMRPIEPVFHRGCTIVLTALAVLSAANVPLFVFMVGRPRSAADPDTSHVFWYMTTLFAAGAAALAILAALRWFRVRLAAVLTPAMAMLLLIVAPFGTAAALAWFFAFRKRETSAL